jgi:hypothetical protein
MIKRLLFSSIVATQFIAFSATGRDDAFRAQDFGSGIASGPSVAVLRADDPLPCPECDPPDGGPPVTLASLLRADDPLPCPECDPPDGGPPLTLVSL